ncbi:MAG: N-acetylneuraminate synthase [Ilumatobacter fluminis]|uniref:N-acetylneuraminate synthase n=1 Tax=Ilumatobacter fluminis TaxID=467091 RepID=UPI0032ED64F3
MNLDDDCYVIAEIGVNHNGSVDTARRLIDVAADAGADAVKFQTFFADDLVTTAAEKAAYQARNTGNDESQHAMLTRLELDESEFRELSAYCVDRGIDFLSTPFGERAADLLERIGVSAFKVSSGDLTYHQFLAHLAEKGLPIILSTGMATLAEVDAALAAIDGVGPVPVALLHCVSDYPAAPETCNLAAMETMRRAFGRPVGWSDHTTGAPIGLAAVALGASVIEKHITLDRTLHGPDHRASMEPDDFREYVAGIRDIQSALGDGIKRPHPDELRTAEVARRSIVAVRDLGAGSIVRSEDVAILRPGTGLQPSMLDLVVGCRLARDVPANRALMAEDLHA